MSISVPSLPLATGNSFVTESWACHIVTGPDDLDRNESIRYSRMKYGDPSATREIAEGLAPWLLERLHLHYCGQIPRQVFLASSAYGAVPTASQALARELVPLLERSGIRVRPFKIHREGGFERTNYGKLDLEARLEVVGKRKLSLDPDVMGDLKDQCVLVLDDLRCSGAHELKIWELFRQSVEPQALFFAYWIRFAGQLVRSQPEQEDIFNHAEIRNLHDLHSLFAEGKLPYLNARLLKFILKAGQDRLPELEQFLSGLNMTQLEWLYLAAHSPDGYSKWKGFRRGVKAIKRALQGQSIHEPV